MIYEVEISKVASGMLQDDNIVFETSTGVSASIDPFHVKKKIALRDTVSISKEIVFGITISNNRSSIIRQRISIQVYEE